MFVEDRSKHKSARIHPPGLSHGILRLGSHLAFCEAGLQGLDRGRHPGDGNRRRGSDSFNLPILLGDAQCGQDGRTILRDHLLRLAVWMGQHAHHGVSEKRIFQPHASFLNLKMFEMVGNGMDHPHLVFETGEVIETRQPLHILHIRRGDAQGDLSLLRDHRIGAQTAVTGQIGHIRRFGKEQDVESCRLHQPGTTGDAF